VHLFFLVRLLSFSFRYNIYFLLTKVLQIFLMMRCVRSVTYAELKLMENTETLLSQLEDYAKP